MKKTNYFLLGVGVVLLCGFTTVILENGIFSGTFTGLDNGITNSAGLTVEQRASGSAAGVAQPPSANLTNWSAMATTVKLSVTNAPIVAATTGITVTPTTNASGQITYTLSVP